MNSVPRRTRKSGIAIEPSNVLAELLGSRARAQVLRVLFGLETKPVYRAEIVRRSGLADQGVDEQLRLLETLGLITSKPDGNRRYFAANTEHPFYGELRGMVVKSVGLRDLIAAAVQHPSAEIVFVFGSIASRTERPDSDVDLMVFGEVSAREMAPAIRPLHEQLGREVNACFFSRAEVGRRMASRDHFLRRVLAESKLFVVGDEQKLSEWIANAPKSEAPRS